MGDERIPSERTWFMAVLSTCFLWAMAMSIIFVTRDKLTSSNCKSLWNFGSDLESSRELFSQVWKLTECNVEFSQLGDLL